MTGRRRKDIRERRKEERKGWRDEEEEKARVVRESGRWKDWEREREREGDGDIHERIRAQRVERTKEERQSGITRGGSRLSHDGGRRTEGEWTQQGRVRAGSEGVAAVAAAVEEESAGAKRGKQREGGGPRTTGERGPGGPGGSVGVWQGARDPIGSRPGHIISGCSPR